MLVYYIVTQEITGTRPTNHIIFDEDGNEYTWAQHAESGGKTKLSEEQVGRLVPKLLMRRGDWGQITITKCGSHIR